jgi:hypothetical protein
VGCKRIGSEEEKEGEGVIGVRLDAVADGGGGGRVWGAGATDASPRVTQYPQGVI